MGAIKVNAAGLRAFRDGLAHAADGDMMKRCCQELADAVVEAAQGRTPVDTGRLRSGFSVELTENGAVVLNPVAYASFVELGHRTKGGGWMPGRFMLEFAADEVRMQTPEKLRGVISDYLKGVLGW